MCDGKPPTSLPVPYPGTAGEIPPWTPCFGLRSLRSLCLVLLIPTSLFRLERISDPRPTHRQGRGRFPLRRPRPKATPPPLTSAVRQPTPPTNTEFIPRIASEAFFRVHPSHHTTRPAKTLGNHSKSFQSPFRIKLTLKKSKPRPTRHLCQDHRLPSPKLRNTSNRRFDPSSRSAATARSPYSTVSKCFDKPDFGKPSTNSTNSHGRSRHNRTRSRFLPLATSQHLTNSSAR